MVLEEKLAEVRGRMMQLDKDALAARTLANNSRVPGVERDAAQARAAQSMREMYELKPAEAQLAREYSQAKVLAEACDSWAADYGKVGGGLYPGDPGRSDLVCALDRPGSWGAVALAVGEAARAQAARW